MVLSMRGKNMKSFFLDEFKNEKEYIDFIKFMLVHSDKFSLIYFKYKENESFKKTVKQVKKLLKPYKIFSCYTDKWPGTVTLNENHHIYNFTLYKSEPDAYAALSIAKGIFDWHYPNFPMDLCFYKNGYAWFELSAHSGIAYINENDTQIINDLKHLGAQIEYYKDIPEQMLFLEKSIKDR